ncbi:MAG: SDR family oxidoreductase [Bryobacteraceae bacterium]|nr:SDR family oxidoreductase [Bryobacteraceae bacterium]
MQNPGLARRKRVALVTGVTRKKGIGAAIAFALARADVDVGVSYWRPYDRTMPWGVRDAEPEEIVNGLREIGVRSHGFEIDLSEPGGPQVLFRRAREQFGQIDILVNNAAYSTESSVDGLNAETLDRHYAVNLRAVMLLCAEFVRTFQPGAGRIISLTSGQGLGPLPNELAYAATKGGIEAFTQSLSAAVAHRGITVNAVDPGPTDTGWMTREVQESLIHNAPMGRLGMPEDAAKVITFLASEEAQWVTGQIIRSRGGN